MTTRKFGRTALIAVLALSIIMSITGGTIAWFTDEVTSANNVIQAGNLDVGVSVADAYDAATWKNIETDGPVFDYDRWEPGFTQIKYLKIENKGNLAFKFMVRILPTLANTVGGTNLSDVIDVYIKEVETGYAAPASFAEVTEANGWTNVGNVSDLMIADEAVDSVKHGVMLQDQEPMTVAVALHMQETAGNEYQGLSVGKGFVLQLLATQYTKEEDSFGPDYDAGATYLVKTADDLKNALASDAQNIKLENSITLQDNPLTIATGTEKVIDLNGKSITGSSTNDSASNLITVKSGSSLTLKNGTVSSFATKPDLDWGANGTKPYPGYANNTIKCEGTLIIDGATIENTTAVGGASYAIDCYQGSDLTVNSGKILGNDKVAIRMFANSNTLSTNVTINGGEVSGKRAIWIQLPGSNSANVRPVNLTINGGTLSSTDDPNGNYLAIYSYSYGDSFAKTKVTINGGTFNGHVAFGGGYKGDQETVIVKGGTFNGELGRYLEDDGWENITVTP